VRAAIRLKDVWVRSSEEWNSRRESGERNGKIARSIERDLGMSGFNFAIIKTGAAVKQSNFVPGRLRNPQSNRGGRWANMISITTKREERDIGAFGRGPIGDLSRTEMGKPDEIPIRA